MDESGAGFLVCKPSPIEKINPGLNRPPEKLTDKEGQPAGERAISPKELWKKWKDC